MYELDFMQKQQSLTFCSFKSVRDWLVLSSLAKVSLRLNKSFKVWISTESEDKQLKATRSARCDIWYSHSQCAPSTTKQVPGNFLIGQLLWNKLASLGYASPKLRNYDLITDLLTGVKCRATSVAKNNEPWVFTETAAISSYLCKTLSHVSARFKWTCQVSVFVLL